MISKKKRTKTVQKVLDEAAEREHKRRLRQEFNDMPFRLIAKYAGDFDGLQNYLECQVSSRKEGYYG